VPAAADAPSPKPYRSRRSRAAAAGAPAAAVGTAALASGATEAAPAVAPPGSDAETSVLAPEAEAPAADAVDERVRLLAETPSVEPEAGYLEPEQPYYYDHAASPAGAAALTDQPEVSTLEPEPPAYGSSVEETAPAEGGEEAASGAAAAAIGTSTGAVVGAAAVDPASLTEAGQAPVAPSTKFERRLERMRTEPTSGVADATAIGTETALFDCPTCSRPLPVGTSRCPQCGTRLIGRRTARRVGTLAAAALVAVVAVAVGITAVLAMSGGPGIATAPSSAPSASGGTGTATPSIALTPAPATPGIPAGAAVALSGTTLVNTRITQDGRALAAVLADKNARTIDVARAIRVIAADAQQGLDMSGRLAPWTEAATVAAQLDAFYRSLADTARDALRASLTDDGTYRRAAARIVTEIRKVDEVDAASRTLATSVGLQLPALGDPGSVISPPPS
jgi:hypothetical protein